MQKAPVPIQLPGSSIGTKDKIARVISAPIPKKESYSTPNIPLNSSAMNYLTRDEAEDVIEEFDEHSPVANKPKKHQLQTKSKMRELEGTNTVTDATKIIMKKAVITNTSSSSTAKDLFVGMPRDTTIRTSSNLHEIINAEKRFSKFQTPDYTAVPKTRAQSRQSYDKSKSKINPEVINLENDDDEVEATTAAALHVEPEISPRIKLYVDSIAYGPYLLTVPKKSQHESLQTDLYIRFYNGPFVSGVILGSEYVESTQDIISYENINKIM